MNELVEKTHTNSTGHDAMMCLWRRRERRKRLMTTTLFQVASHHHLLLVCDDGMISPNFRHTFPLKSNRPTINECVTVEHVTF